MQIIDCTKEHSIETRANESVGASNASNRYHNNQCHISQCQNIQRYKIAYAEIANVT